MDKRHIKSGWGEGEERRHAIFQLPSNTVALGRGLASGWVSPCIAKGHVCERFLPVSISLLPSSLEISLKASKNTSVLFLPASQVQRDVAVTAARSRDTHSTLGCGQIGVAGFCITSTACLTR